MKIVFTPFRSDDVFVNLAEEMPPGVIFAVAMGDDDFAREIAGADILIANNRSYTESFARILAENSGPLGWIQFSTAGYERALRNGIPEGVTVTNARGIGAPVVAEHAITLMLASFRRIREMEDARARRIWAREEINPLMRSLEDMTLAVVGSGAIGREVARKAKAFDMKVICVTRSADAGPDVDEVAPRAALGKVLSRADAVVICTSSDADSFHLLGTKELDAMKEGALVVNVARGELIDEPALIAALKAGKISAAIDVAEGEPLAADSELWQLDNVLISPHVAGGGNRGGYKRFRDLLLSNLECFNAGKPIPFAIDWQKEAADLKAGG